MGYSVNVDIDEETFTKEEEVAPVEEPVLVDGPPPLPSSKCPMGAPSECPVPQCPFSECPTPLATDVAFVGAFLLGVGVGALLVLAFSSDPVAEICTE